MVNLFCFCFCPLLIQFLFLGNSEEKMLLLHDLAGKVLYLLTLIILLLLYLRKWKRNRGGGRRRGEVGDTTGGQYAGEVRFNVAGDDDCGTINGEIAMGRTSLAATMPFEFN